MLQLVNWSIELKTTPFTGIRAVIEPSKQLGRRGTLAVFLLAGSCLLLAACGGTDADKFIGTWHRVNYPKEIGRASCRERVL